MTFLMVFAVLAFAVSVWAGLHARRNYRRTKRASEELTRDIEAWREASESYLARLQREGDLGKYWKRDHP